MYVLKNSLWLLKMDSRRKKQKQENKSGNYSSIPGKMIILYLSVDNG